MNRCWFAARVVAVKRKYGLNREGDRGVVHRMPTPLASRFVHLEIRVDAADWCAWGAANGIAPEVLFFVSMRPELLHAFNPQSTEKAFPCATHTSVTGTSRPPPSASAG